MFYVMIYDIIGFTVNPKSATPPGGVNGMSLRRRWQYQGGSHGRNDGSWGG